MEFHRGDQVIVDGEVYEVLSKRCGLDFYEIGRRHMDHGQEYFTHIREGLYSDQLKMVTESMKENARDIQMELQRTRGDE